MPFVIEQYFLKNLKSIFYQNLFVDRISLATMNILILISVLSVQAVSNLDDLALENAE